MGLTMAMSRFWVIDLAELALDACSSLRRWCCFKNLGSFGTGSNLESPAGRLYISSRVGLVFLRFYISVSAWKEGPNEAVDFKFSVREFSSQGRG